MNSIYLLFVVLLVLIWGVNFVVIKLGLDGFPPIFLAFARFFLTSLPAVFFLKRPKAPFRQIALYGLVMFALQFACFFIGMQLGVPPGLAAILVQINVFFSLLLAMVFFQEKLKLLQIIGALVSFSGITYAGMNVGGDISLAGFFLLIAAAAFWGAGSAISKTIGNVNMVSLVAWGSLIAWPPLLLLSLLVEGLDQIAYSLEHLSWISIGALAYLTYLSTLFGFGLWSWLLYHLPLSKVAPFTMLVPIIAMLASSLILGESLESWKIGAAILVIGGLFINNLSFKRQSR